MSQARAQEPENYPPHSTAVRVDSTNLPIVFIEVGGKMILKDDKITARMKIIDNGTGQLNYTDTKYEKNTATFPFFIGCNLRFNNNAWAPENMYSGCIDDYVFYKRALSEAEIKALAFAD